MFVRSDESVIQSVFHSGRLDMVERPCLVGRKRPNRVFPDRVLPRETDRYTLVAVAVEHHQRVRNRELKYSVRLEYMPKTVGPAVDWHEVFACVVGDVLRSHRN